MKDVACIIITYNRLELLKRVLEKVKVQTNQDFDVIIVNNGSSDGTKEWLENQVNIIVINQYPNIGCAGGVHMGMEYAYTHGYKWFWLMDDDGIPADDQLEKLLRGAEKHRSFYVNSLVLDMDNHERLSFGLTYQNQAILTRKMAQEYEAIPNTVNPWNGTLISRKIRDKIGPVKKEMLLWGEEMEYMYRSIRAGFTLYTITDAMHYHPASRLNYAHVLPLVKNRFKVLLNNSEQKLKIMYRNNGYLYKTYFNPHHTLRYRLKYNLYYLLRFNIGGLIMFNKFFNQGARDDFSELLI